MKNKFSQAVFIMAVFILIGIIVIYGIKAGNNYDIGNGNISGNAAYGFNYAERKYIETHDAVNIYVDKDLRYLKKGENDGFLGDYFRNIFEGVDLDINLTTSRKNADCSLMVITDKIRDESHEVMYTGSVFQIEGALFIKNDAPHADHLKGIVMDERMDAEDLRVLKYKGCNIDFKIIDSADEAVTEAVETESDCILGDRFAIINALGDNKDYLPVEEVVYSNNVCMVVPKEKTELYDILNDCIYNVDKHQLTYAMGQKWFEGNGPRYMNESYDDIYMFILIIFASILIAFLIYYQANKNLYKELDDRMEKLAESKQELKTTFNGVGYYMAEINLEGNILDINRAFYNFVETDTSNRKIWDVMNLEDKYKNRIQHTVQEASKSKTHKNDEIKVKRQNLVIDVFPIESPRGAVEKLLFMAMDVTNERMAERQLLQDNKMIAVGQLAAGVAHEIRNPLGIIRNYCYVLKNMDDDKVKEKAIEQIEKSVDNSSAIINNLLNFSRISDKQRETVNIKDHIWSLIQLNNNILKKKNINLEIICEETVVSFLSVESLDMILINLISNATDAMVDNGKLTIKVEKYKDTFEIEVQDTGTGIDEDILQDIFNPFFTTKGNQKGNGLGLYIVYNETNKMNGTIEVESKLGEGSKFKLTLPLAEDIAGKEEKND